MKILLIAAICLIFGLPSPSHAQEKSTDCRVEVWKKDMRGVVPMMVGTTTCEAGELTCRLFDAETGEFITAGFHYFSGYIFQAYPNISEWPMSVDLKYVIYTQE